MPKPEEVGEPICVRLEDDLVKEIDKFQKEMGYSYRTEAIRKLLKMGLEKSSSK